MTNLTQCDKCKQSFKGFFNMSIKSHTYIEFMGHVPNPEMHLCRKCEELLKEWLKQ